MTLLLVPILNWFDPRAQANFISQSGVVVTIPSWHSLVDGCASELGQRNSHIIQEENSKDGEQEVGNGTSGKVISEGERTTVCQCKPVQDIESVGERDRVLEILADFLCVMLDCLSSTWLLDCLLKIFFFILPMFVAKHKSISVCLLLMITIVVCETV